MDIYGSNQFISGTKEFVNNNSLIARISFILLIIICFVILFNIGYWILTLILSPSKSPYLVDGMKDAKTYLQIPQSLQSKGAKPIYRSRDQYNGLEFTWSTWFYINDPTYKSEQTYKNIFVKVSTSQTGNGIYNNTNGPGVYLTNVPINDVGSYVDGYNNVTISLYIVLDIFPYNDPVSGEYIYKQPIIIENMPIKKWVNLIIRCNAQNIVDIFINGSLMKRVKLYNSIKQNYDDVYVSANGGFDGFISSLRYFNYSIGTFEVDQIVNSGPNLKIDKDNNLAESNPYYLSTKWLFGEKYST